MGVGGSLRCLEKSKEWGAAAVNCSQPWRHSPGCTSSSSGLGLTPWTQMLLPASSSAPVPSPEQGCSRASPLVSLPTGRLGCSLVFGGEGAPPGPTEHQGRPGLVDVGCAQRPSPHSC